MWPFNKKKTGKNKQSRPLCRYCESPNINIIFSPASEQPDYVRTWRGQRYVTCKCLDCGKEFYIAEPAAEVEELIFRDNSFIADEDELLAAEEELRRQTDEEDDRRYKY